MRISASLRASAWMGTCSALFLLSSWAPLNWDATNDHVAEKPASCCPDTHACGLALVPPPRLSAGEMQVLPLGDFEVPEHINLRWEEPQPPLAGLGRTLTDATTDLDPPDVRIAATPARPQPEPTLPLATLDVACSPEPVAVHEPAPWQRPAALVALMEKVRECAAAAPWAEQVLADLERLLSPSLDTAAQQALLEQLAQKSAEVEKIIESIDDETWETLLRRARYALSRRVDLWRGVLDVHQQAGGDEALASDGRELLHCMAEVDSLMQGPAGDGWRSYLMLDSLQELSRAQARRLASDDRALMRRVLQRLDYARRLPGREEFVSQGPLAVLDEQLRRMSAEPVDTSLLLASLERYEETGKASIGHDISEDLKRLAYSPHQEHQDLARRIEEHYRNCNVRVAVTEELLNRYLPEQEPVEAAVRDVVLGIPVRGRSTTINELSLRLVPDPLRLRLELTANGKVHSSTTSQRGSVAFHTRSESTYTARKLLEFGAQGFQGEPADAEAHTVSRLRSVQSDFDVLPLIGDIVQDYARDGYRERREAARREVQAKVERQAAQKLDRLAEEGFGRVHERFRERVMTPLERLRLVPTYTESRTDERRFTLRTRLAASHHLAANTPRPRALSDSLLSLQVHESAANNVLDHMDLAGKRFTAEELRRHIGQCFNLSKAIEPSSADDYAVTFADNDPVHVRFNEGRVELTLRIARLESGSRSWQNFNVYVNYRPEAVGRSVELARDGIISLDGERLGMQSQFVLRGTFGRIFSDERRVRWLTDFIEDDERLAGLQVTQFVLEDGWLGVAIGPQRSEAIALGR